MTELEDDPQPLGDGETTAGASAARRWIDVAVNNALDDVIDEGLHRATNAALFRVVEIANEHPRPPAVERYLRLYGFYAFAEDVLADRVRHTEAEKARLRDPVKPRDPLNKTQRIT